jgi:hypothetical protein
MPPERIDSLDADSLKGLVLSLMSSVYQRVSASPDGNAPPFGAYYAIRPIRGLLVLARPRSDLVGA